MGKLFWYLWLKLGQQCVYCDDLHFSKYEYLNIKIFVICRRCRLARQSIEHSGTNIAQHNQILHSAVLLQVAHAEDNLREMGGSCEYNKQAVVDSRERVVFLLGR